MPTVSMFYGVVISMYWEDGAQHHEPHFHARYGDSKAVFNLQGEVLAGELPPNQETFVKAWALIHHDELRANWVLACSHEQLFRIDPLR